MIRLHPTPESDHLCPFCRILLQSRGWHIPGMRNLADLLCSRCGREFYGDLPSGQALYTPMLLERATGAVHDSYGVEWFADWLRDSYARRTDTPLSFETEEMRPITRPVVLLNCLDTLYGHSLLKLLNAQFYLDRRPDVDVIIMIPSFLRWMIPDGIAQVWTVDLPLPRGTQWNDWLAREIQRRLKDFPVVHLSIALSHPHPDDFDIRRFTRIEPFPLDEWDTRRAARPTVTFIWREDRLWHQPQTSASGYVERIKRQLRPPSDSQTEQLRPVSSLADMLRHEFPALDFAVAGLGAPGNLPRWIQDLRRTHVDASIEREWCERYAASHLVVGVHGSNMLLPSAHAGGVVELIDPARWGNFLQDILPRSGDYRDMFFRYHFLPDSATPATLAQLLGLLLRSYTGFRLLMHSQFSNHEIDYKLLRQHPS